ncbi:MAG: PIG-L family deacetylase [Candidatus Hydrogenedentota bacterium]
MDLSSNDKAVLHVPDGVAANVALARCNYLGIGAHQDDLEIMAIEGILECFGSPDRWFGGVIVNNGASAPRTGRFSNYTNEQMAAARIEEQNRAADIGKYSIQVQLGYSNDETKDPADLRPMRDILEIIRATRPGVIYTHNLLDKHYAHVAVTIQVIQAIRQLDSADRPTRLVGCEVWRDLDWLVGDDKVVMDTTCLPELQRELLEVFESQLEGKRYDRAAMGRRIAHATYLDPHENDKVEGAVFGMDLTPLITDDSLNLREYALGYVERLNTAVADQLDELL